MTIALDRPVPERPVPDPMRDDPSGALATTAAAERVSWSKPAKWLWVAATETDYLGMVDRNLDGFCATGFDGFDLGVFAARSDAQAAVSRYWSERG
jgi:hypothetical protein